MIEWLLASGIGVAGPVPGEAGLSGPGYSVRVWQMEQGLPQSAEKILRQIHSLAVERKEWGQALHALS